MLTIQLSKAGLDALPRQVAELALESTLAGATATVREARRSVEEIHGSGVQYARLPNRSSAPGQAPQGQTGELVSTIQTSQEDAEGIGAEAVAGDGSGKALAMELGTSNMAPRPFMGPAAEAGRAAAESSLIEGAKALGRV